MKLPGDLAAGSLKPAPEKMDDTMLKPAPKDISCRYGYQMGKMAENISQPDKGGLSPCPSADTMLRKGGQKPRG
ncbi:MAG: hypothetical protein IPI37_00005 [Bacteroidales bacterium]|nr:hypothetical protein [Bacteroidales bacterium]